VIEQGLLLCIKASRKDTIRTLAFSLTKISHNGCRPKLFSQKSDEKKNQITFHKAIDDDIKIVVSPHQVTKQKRDPNDINRVRQNMFANEKIQRS
jgi:hypothetical protein